MTLTEKFTIANLFNLFDTATAPIATAREI